MSGAPVILAGTMPVAAGTVQYISNNSGHYAPKMADLMNGCRQLTQSGLNDAALAKVSVLYADYEGRFGAGAATYLFPMQLFVTTAGAVPDRENYRLTLKFSWLYWTSPEAARPAHPATIGQRDRNGVQASFPA